MFYNFFGVTPNEKFAMNLIVYASLTNTNQQKNENAQRRMLRAIFFKKKLDSQTYVLLDNKLVFLFILLK